MNDMPCRDFTNLFADDSSSYVIESNATKLEEKLQLRTNNICIWFFKWLLSVNTEKLAIDHGFSFSENVTCLCTCASFHRQEHYTPGQFSSTLGRHPSRVSVLGLPYRSRCVEGFAAKLGFLQRITNCLDPLVIRDLYMYCILPATEYASEVWSSLSTTDTIRLENVNRRAARLILKVPSSSQISQDHDILLARAGLQLISIRRKLRQAMFCFKYFKGFHPEHI